MIACHVKRAPTSNIYVDYVDTFSTLSRLLPQSVKVDTYDNHNCCIAGKQSDKLMLFCVCLCTYLVSMMSRDSNKSVWNLFLYLLYVWKHRKVLKVNLLCMFLFWNINNNKHISRSKWCLYLNIVVICFRFTKIRGNQFWSTLTMLSLIILFLFRYLTESTTCDT